MEHRIESSQHMKIMRTLNTRRNVPPFCNVLHRNAWK